MQEESGFYWVIGGFSYSPISSSEIIIGTVPLPTPNYLPSSVSSSLVTLEGSTINNFRFGMIKDGSQIGFTKDVQSSSFSFTQTEIEEIKSLEPDYLFVENNNESFEDTGQKVNFKFTYPYVENKLDKKIKE